MRTIKELAQFLKEQLFNPAEYDRDHSGLNEHAQQMFNDIGSLYRVNWHEVASNFLLQ